MSEMTSALPPANLSGAFAPQPRASGLQGLVKRQPTTAPTKRDAGQATSVPTSQLPEEAAEIDDARAATSAGSLPTTRDTRSKVAEPVRQVTVYVPIQVRDELVAERDGARARRLPTTTTDIVLDAVESAVPHLGQLIAPTSESTGGLFTHQAVRRPRQDTVQLGMRLDAGDLRTLDELAAQHATSRSRLVAVALERRYDRAPSRTS